LPLGLTVMTMGVSAALWTSFKRSEFFIHLVAGADTRFSVDPSRHELIWSGRISYFMPNIVFGYVSSQPAAKWTLVLTTVRLSAGVTR
jgi:hypothetical protein